MTTSETHSALIFREVQRFRQPWVWILLGLVLTHSIVYIGLDHGQWGPTSFIVAGIALFAMLRLTTEVDAQQLRVRFAPFVNKRIPLSQITRAEVVEYHPLKEYGGWGIRRGKEGWAYTTAGREGVRIVTADKTSFLVGSQRAQELAEVLRSTSRSPAAT